MARKRTNSEGGIDMTRKEELVEYWKQIKEVDNSLEQAQERVKQLKAEKKELESKIGWSIEHIDQPNLPFGCILAGDGECTPAQASDN